MKKSRQSLGQWGERVAEKYLADLGYTIIERNVRTPYGEIDLIARDEQAIIFVEVKTRTTETYGLPEDAITQRKREHLISAASFYFQQHPEIEGDWRIDVVAIQNYTPKQPPVITHFKNAISS